MSDLIRFLLARLNEETTYSKGVFAWDADVPAWALDMTPAMELRLELECEAKRRIVELHHISDEGVYDADGIERPGKDCTECWDEFPCDTLRLLAVPYADHPDYNEAWKP